MAARNWSALLVRVLAIAGTVALGTPGPVGHASGHSAAPSLDVVIQRIQVAITHPGMLYHQAITSSGDADIAVSLQGSSASFIQQWIDPQRDLARETISFLASKRPLLIGVVKKGTLVTEDPATHLTHGPFKVSCGGSMLLPARLVLGCPNARFRGTTTVAAGSYRGRPAIILDTRGTDSRTYEETVHFTRRLYLDARTYLPLAKTAAQKTEGSSRVTRATALYRTEFVSTRQLAPHFFDQSPPGYASPIKSIALADRAALAGLAPDFTLDWLGIRFPGVNGYPPLVLAHLDMEAPGSLSYVNMDYLDATHPNGGTFGLTISAGNPTVSHGTPTTNCGTRTVTLPAGSMTIYCQEAGKYFVGQGTLGQTFVTVFGMSRFMGSRVTKPHKSQTP